MNYTLGKIFTLLLLTLKLYGLSNLATYEFTSSNINPFVKEAVEIKFKATQTDQTDVMFFFLEAKKSDNYKIVLLNKDAKELAYHIKETTFTYLLFPLKSGKIDVDFDFIIKVASDEAVAQVFQGSRDNVKWIETTNTAIDLQSFVLDVKSLYRDVDLVGDFTISSTLSRSTINSYESANISYNLNGIGYDTFNISPITKINDVKIFTDITKDYDKATPDGYKIHREFNYALISKDDIDIPAQSFKCYSPKREQYYTINTKAHHIKVQTIDKSDLIDNMDYPKEERDFKIIKTLLIYLIIFISGFFTAKYMPSSLSFKKSKEYADIRDTKSAKELLYLLMHTYSHYGFKNYYEELNDIVYGNASKIKFHIIKRRLLKELKK